MAELGLLPEQETTARHAVLHRERMHRNKFILKDLFMNGKVSSSASPTGPNKFNGAVRICKCMLESNPNNPKKWSPCRWLIKILWIRWVLILKRASWIWVASPQSIRCKLPLTLSI